MRGGGGKYGRGNGGYGRRQGRGREGEAESRQRGEIRGCGMSGSENMSFRKVRSK